MSDSLRDFLSEFEERAKQEYPHKALFTDYVTSDDQNEKICEIRSAFSKLYDSLAEIYPMASYCERSFNRIEDHLEIACMIMCKVIAKG